MPVLVKVSQNKNDKTAAFGKWYGRVVSTKTMTYQELCKHMSEHNSVYGEDVCLGVANKLQNCMLEQLTRHVLPLCQEHRHPEGVRLQPRRQHPGPVSLLCPQPHRCEQPLIEDAEEESRLYEREGPRGVQQEVFWNQWNLWIF